MKESNSNYSVAFTVFQDVTYVFDAINNVRGWWIDEIDGDTDHLHDEFSVRFGDVHYSKQRITDFVPNSKVTWLVTDSHLSFVENSSEWTGTKITFDISSERKGTRIKFTHWGLSPDMACFDGCSDAWRTYIKGSLRSLIQTGNGNPTKAGELKPVNKSMK